VILPCASLFFYLSRSIKRLALVECTTIPHILRIRVKDEPLRFYSRGGASLCAPNLEWRPKTNSRGTRSKPEPLLCESQKRFGTFCEIQSCRAGTLVPRGRPRRYIKTRSLS
jgi:hypothetical protein